MTVEVNTSKGVFLFVEVADGAITLPLWNVLVGLNTVDLPPGQWAFLSTTKEIGEELGGEVTKEEIGVNSYWFRDFTSDYGTCYTAIESLQSLMLSEGMQTDKNYAILRQGNNN